MQDNRRHQLIEANLRTIVTHGLTGATITQIADAAGISRGLINFHFSSKDQLMVQTLRALIDEAHAALLAPLQTPEPIDPLETLHAVIEGQLREPVAQPERLAAWSAFIGHAPANATYAELLSEYQEIEWQVIRQLWRAILKNIRGRKKGSGNLTNQTQAMLQGLKLARLLNPDGDPAMLAQPLHDFIARQIERAASLNEAFDHAAIQAKAERRARQPVRLKIQPEPEPEEQPEPEAA